MCCGTHQHSRPETAPPHGKMPPHRHTHTTVQFLRIPGGDSHPPSYLSKLGRGGGILGGGGGLEGVGGFGCGGAGPKSQAGGGLRVTHYYHMSTYRGDVCLGGWGYGGMYVIMALSHLCPEESLNGRRFTPNPGSSLRNKRHLYSAASCALHSLKYLAVRFLRGGGGNSHPPAICQNLGRGGG